MEKLFIGPTIRALREARAWKLEPCAARLGISVSYLSQIESNQRPATQRVLLALVDTFGVAVESLDVGGDQRLVADLREAVAESAPGEPALPLSELRRAALHAPGLVRRYLDLHQANHRLGERLRLTEEAVAVDETQAASSLLPYEEVRDYFHYQDNYIHNLDLAAERLAEAIGLGERPDGARALEEALRHRLGVSVTHDAAAGLIRRYDAGARRLSLNPAHPAATRNFQMAYHLAAAELSDIIEDELARAHLRSPEAAAIGRVGLENFAAGAVIMPYRRFAAAARSLRHDVERLALGFQTSLEQVCHRLSNLQRPGARGLPIYFLRADYAGNITKRHSATRFRFARFGGSCPIWNIHEAIGAPDRFSVQIAEMPDGVRYLSVARSVVKRSYSYLVPDRRYVLGFGCETAHADAFVYSEGLDLDGPAARIGVSCRICERNDCPQRAFPPVDRRLTVTPNERATVPYQL
jgi:predicted transcriptional regulator/transcriptional regulator with XRE-family HTH domain